MFWVYSNLPIPCRAQVGTSLAADARTPPYLIALRQSPAVAAAAADAAKAVVAFVWCSGAGSQSGVQRADETHSSFISKAILVTHCYT